MKGFASSVQHITGQQLDVKAASSSDPMAVVEEELELLRLKVDELSDEVRIDPSSCLQLMRMVENESPQRAKSAAR